MNLNLQSIVKKVPANQTLPVACTGTYLLLYSSTGTFTFSVDGGPPQTGLTILGINFGEDATNLHKRPFTNILLTDTSGADNTILFFVSNAPITFYQALQTVLSKAAPTFMKGSGEVNPVDGAATVYNGVGPAGQTRKTFIVQNIGNTTLFLQDGGAATGVEIPSTLTVPLSFELTGSITVKNIAGSGAGKFCVMEIFYQ